MYNICISNSNVHNQCKNYKIFFYIIIKLKSVIINKFNNFKLLLVLKIYK